MPRTTQEYHHQDAPGADAGAAVLDDPDVPPGIEFDTPSLDCRSRLAELHALPPVPPWLKTEHISGLDQWLESWREPDDSLASWTARIETAIRIGILDREDKNGFAVGSDGQWVPPKRRRTRGQGKVGTCADLGSWVIDGECAGQGGSRHEFVKYLPCGLPWCRVCGANDSTVHKRRVAEWLGTDERPKALGMGDMVYIVGTMPDHLWKRYRDTRQLRRAAKESRALMKELYGFIDVPIEGSEKTRKQAVGFDRGLWALHEFGDPPEDGSIPTFKPHFNMVMDAHPYRGKVTLSALKAGFRGIWRIPCECGAQAAGEDYRCKCVVVRREFKRTPAEKMFCLKYVLRSTFLKLEWDPELAKRLSGFRRRQTWGQGPKEGQDKWGGPVLWEPPVGEAPSKAVRDLVAGQCPICGSVMSWIVGPEELDSDPESKTFGQVKRSARMHRWKDPPVKNEWEDLGGGYLHRSRTFPQAVSG